MITVRRWWNQYGALTGLTALAIVAGLVVRQTQGAVISEWWVLLRRPFINPEQAASVQSESITLQSELANARFAEMQQRLVELQAENERLGALAGLQRQTQGKGITAPVVGRSGDHWWQQATLGLGSNDGIAKNQVVMAPGGLVGYIDSVTPNTSRVLLISDTNSQTGVVVSRSRAPGYMRGIGNNRAVMEFFEKVPDVRVGDAIAISNLSKKYPKGLPVGRIESIALDKSPAPEAMIELSTPISSLEWVIVYPSVPILDKSPEAQPTDRTPSPNEAATPLPPSTSAPPNKP